MTAKDVKPCKFNSLSTAESFIEKSITWSKWSIILGDDNRFWVVTNREASILMKAGYELAA